MATTTNRFLLIASLLSLSLAAGSLMLRADEPKQPSEPPATGKPDAKTDKPPREPGDKDLRDKDGREKDEKRPRPDGTRPDGPRGEWGRPPGAGQRPLDQFSPEELRTMIEAVEAKNKKLAEKMKERLAEFLAKKPQQLTREQIDAAIAVFEDREPRLAERIKESLKDNPERVSSMLAFQWPRLEKTIELKKTDRELYDAQTAEIVKQSESRGLIWQLRKATQDKNQPEIAKLKDELHAKLVQQHQARQAIRKLELARMNDKIKKLSEEITLEEAKSAEIVEKHFKEMLKWTEGGRWGPGEKGGRPDKGDKGEGREKPE